MVQGNQEVRPLVFFDCVTHYGGSNHSTVYMISEMQRNCEVIVLDAYGTCKAYTEALKNHQIKSQVVFPQARRTYIGGSFPMERALCFATSLPDLLALIRRLRLLMKRLNPSVVWTNSHKGLFLLGRASHKQVSLAFYARGQNTYPRAYSRYDWKRVALVAAISESCIAKLRGSRFEPPFMEVIPNGIDVEKTVAMGRLHCSELPPSRGLRLVYPGSLSEMKNQLDAVSGLGQFVQDGGEASLLLVGDLAPGSPAKYQKRLRRTAAAWGVSDRVHFLGWHDNVPSVISQSDVVLLTSKNEGFGRVLLESMSLGKPVLATEVGGIPEVVRHGREGLLVPLHSPTAFSEALSQLSDPEVRRRMGKAGLQRVKNSYDIKAVATRFLAAMECIDNCVSQQRGYYEDATH